MNLTELINKGANVTVNVSPTDLKSFAQDIAKEILTREKPQPERKEKLHTTEQVCDMLSISRVTLWQWEKKDILQPVRMGNLKRYRLSDIEVLIQKKGGK